MFSDEIINVVKIMLISCLYAWIIIPVAFFSIARMFFKEKLMYEMAKKNMLGQEEEEINE